MARSGEIYEHMKSDQLRQWGRNRIKTEPMIMMMQLHCYSYGATAIKMLLYAAFTYIESIASVFHYRPLGHIALNALTFKDIVTISVVIVFLAVIAMISLCVIAAYHLILLRS